ncbi:RNA polymerase sigma factor region1.1 domain-containing protein [Hansschlegelia sp. KR7-227]|uniref:RNA polymerase sigma factor region1.1 domain-containing protein n=1 Tax=Hansschlegelia sp. KR7-227 TaxID=3400914 RepID=UPI003C05335B
MAEGFEDAILASMDRYDLSPDLRERLRRLALGATSEGFVTCEALEQAFGPQEISASVLEDALAYLNDRGLRVLSESEIDATPPPRGTALRVVGSHPPSKPWPDPA